MLALRGLLLRVMLSQVPDAVWPSATPAAAGRSIANNAIIAARLKARALLGRGILVSIDLLAAAPERYLEVTVPRSGGYSSASSLAQLIPRSN
jgi:hypothetical protein